MTPLLLAGLGAELQAISQTGLTFTTTTTTTGAIGDWLDRRRNRGETCRLAGEPTVENFLVQPGYATPKVAVRGAIVGDGELLLVQERADSCWALPVAGPMSATCPRDDRRVGVGGSGLHVVVSKLIGVYDANRRRHPPVVLSCLQACLPVRDHRRGGQAEQETLAAAFFHFDRLPPLSGERTSLRHLTEVRAHVCDPSRLAAFD